MARNFKSVSRPKEGQREVRPEKTCQIQNQGMESCAVCERQACHPDAAYGSGGLERKIGDLLMASDNALVKLLQADHLLPDWSGSKCPRCQRGKLSRLQAKAGEGMPKHRCNYYGCNAWINPHHLHPIFAEACGSGHTSLQTQSALLFLLLNRVPNASIHRILHTNHKVIEDMEKRLMQLRKAWVEEKEKLIVFGNGKTWTDIEADEATFNSTDLKDLAEDSQQACDLGTMVWYCPAWSARHPIAPQVATQHVRQKGPWPRSYQKG